MLKLNENLKFYVNDLNPMLSISVGSKRSHIINRTGLGRNTNKKLRTSVKGLSKSLALFERDNRKVSSLTTRIDLAHLQIIGRELSLGEYAKKARGLVSTILHSTSMFPSWDPLMRTVLR